MAIIKLGTTVIGIRGTIAGITYSANKAGNHAKGWTRGANPRTPNQAAQRARQSVWAAAWRTLSAADQAGWDTYAALPAQTRYNSLGIAYQPSGFACYVSCNSNLARAGDASITTAPAVARPAAPTITASVTSITGSANPTNITVSLADPDIAKRLAVIVTLVNSVGRNVATPNALMRITAASGFSGILGFKSFFETKYGIISLGQKTFGMAAYQDNQGQRGPWSTFSNNVTA